MSSGFKNTYYDVVDGKEIEQTNSNFNRRVGIFAFCRSCSLNANESPNQCKMKLCPLWPFRANTKRKQWKYHGDG